jgi:hypothetical protein
LVVGIVVAVAEASAVVAAEQTGRIGRVPVGWIEAPGKGSFGVEMACSRRGSRYVEGLAAEAAVGIGVVVAVVGLRRSPVVEVDRMHPAIVPVVSDLEVVRAMGFEEQLTVEDQMDWMEQMFVTVSFSKRGWTVAEAVEAAGIVVCPEEGS